MTYEPARIFAIAAKETARAFAGNGKMSAIVSHTTTATYNRNVRMDRIGVDKGTANGSDRSQRAPTRPSPQLLPAGRLRDGTRPGRASRSPADRGG
ncbi:MULTISPECIES: hypothetical protein [Burkholderia]|uniref:hypothetical protein n=1 Tax=Burkholderia TaxID=32008 RepID=UPI00126A331A|nr:MULTISPECIES: hypothetical protein [Burkholderia]